jgi:tetratricopeptide (TPR) repeat protein
MTVSRTPFTARVGLLASAWAAVAVLGLAAPGAFAQPTPSRPKPAAEQGKPTPGAAKSSGEVKTFRRAAPPPTDPKAQAAEEDVQKKGPAGPEQRRTRERTSAEDIDDELAILRELLDIERGSETEADTLLELSYVLWDRAEAYELEAFDEQVEVAIAAANDKGDKAEVKRLSMVQEALKEQARAAKLDVINHLKRIERNFPKFAKLDEVLYSLGFHLHELERPGEAVDAYMRLVRKTPRSSYLPDAYLGIGNYYFGRSQGAEAVKWYTKVIDFPDSQVYGWALYYIAWVAYNTQRYDDAVKGFVRVLDYSKNEARGRVSFVEDATKYLVRSWAETGKPKDAFKFFKTVAEGSENDLLLALARYYAEVAAYEKSNLVLEDLVGVTTDEREVVGLLALILDNAYKLRDLPTVVETAVRVANAIRALPNGASEFESLELLLAEVGSTYHAESERTLDLATLEAAEKVYRSYRDSFPNGPNAYDIRHNHALALFQLADRYDLLAEKSRADKKPDIALQQIAQADVYWKDSAQTYEQVIEMQPAGKYAEPSSHRALIAYLRLQDLDQITAERSVDTADLRPVALTNDQQRIADACERYVGIALKNGSKEDVPEALFVAGRLYYQTNHFDEAGRLLSKLVELFPGHPKLALDSARLMLSAFNLNQDGKSLIAWTNTLIVDPRFNQGPLGVTLTEIKSNEEYNKCLELKATPVQAAECLVRYAKAFPDSPQSPRAMAGAARFYREAKRREDVIATYHELARVYPQDPRAAQAVFEIAEIYRECASFDEAATAYEEFVRAYPTSKLIPQALATARVIREKLGQFDKVVENGEAFLEHCAADGAKEERCSPDRRAQAAYDVTEQYIKKGDWKGVLRASDKFLKRSTSIPTHLRLAALVNTGTAQAKLGVGDKGRKLFDEVLRQAKELSDATPPVTLPEIGREAIAQALFMTGELEYAKVGALKGSPRDLKAAVDLAAKKATLAKGAETYYITVESTKNPRWVSAAASRRGRIYQDIATEIKKLPPPPAFKGDLALEWQTQLADKARPHEETAIERYREALKKAGEIFAFDSYWAEARDNLKILDSRFAEQADIKEFTVDVAPVKWSDPQKPIDAIHDLQLQLFSFSSGEVGEDDIAPGDKTAETTKETAPEVKKAWLRLALAHHALGQHREALVVATVAMQVAPELRKSAQLWNMVGQSHRALGNTREALLAFQEAANGDPTAVEPLLNAAAITIRSLDFSATVALLDQVLSRDPANYWARVTRPVALRRTSDDPKVGQQALALLDQVAAVERIEGHYNRCIVAQAVATNERAPLQRALAACEQALRIAGPKHALTGELKKRVDGLKTTIEFLPADDVTPTAPAADAAPATAPTDVAAPGPASPAAAPATP